MARKLVVSLASAALMTTTFTALHPAPAAAVAATTVVSGHDLRNARLVEFRDKCSATSPNPPEAARLGLKSGTVGTHSIGWQHAVADHEVGALAPVFHPASLSTVLVDVYSPSAHARGHAVAFYYDNTPGFTAGYWVGFRSLTQNASGWGSVSTGSLGLFWEYYENNTLLAYYSDPWTVAQLAGFRGGDGRGAYVGVALGCDQEAFYVDNLRVADAVNQNTYDFEGVPTGSRVSWWTGKKVQQGDLLVGYGSRFWMLGDSYDSIRRSFISGQGTLYEKPYGSSSFRPVTTGSYSPTTFVALKVAPKRQTTYWFATDGTNEYDGSGATPLTVYVAVDLDARINDLSLKPGQRAVVSGKIHPGNRGTKVSLQRKLGRWQNVDTTRSGRGGRFSVGVKATSPGTMVLRLVISAGKGNVGTVTTSVKVTVTPRPKPHPPSGGGGGGGGGGGEDESTPTPAVPAVNTPNTVPGPDDENVRLLAKTRADVPPPPMAPVAPSTCTMPGIYPLAPCPPVRND